MSGAAPELEALSNCPLCGSGERDHRWTAGAAAVQQCRACSLLYIDPCPGPGAMAGIYESSETLSRVHGFHGGYYEYGDPAEDTATRREYQKGLDLLDGACAAPGRRLLDVGFGNGIFLAMARERGWRVSGVDTSAANVELARKRFGLELCRGTLEALGEKPGSFEAVSILDVIEHQTRPGEMLSSARRLLVPGGLLLVSVPNDDSILKYAAYGLYAASGRRWTAGFEKIYLLEHVAYYNRRTLGLLMSGNGFETVSHFYGSTDLAKYRLPAAEKIAAAGLLFLGRLLGCQNRLIMLARKTGE